MIMIMIRMIRRRVGSPDFTFLILDGFTLSVILWLAHLFHIRIVIFLIRMIKMMMYAWITSIASDMDFC